MQKKIKLAAVAITLLLLISKYYDFNKYVKVIFNDFKLNSFDQVIGLKLSFDNREDSDYRKDNDIDHINKILEYFNSFEYEKCEEFNFDDEVTKFMFENTKTGEEKSIHVYNENEIMVYIQRGKDQIFLLKVKDDALDIEYIENLFNNLNERI
ncbi:hypothetical protein Curi_c02240 [Gottschalkia acidurici 9a]|uniref:Uncharacterized protein n=1 Tax=Gottschalkia acidurici (strain ATCC 7906 / DSM 604 / BCRC 14475 / CIP 104303 / KCTC 5404 / NCIMB 10678 / 9a) TaxID=1128398 RepID=K0AVJ8_GOTA9|nr:hypothetical protein [Gottschalkia acidurici]AFS77304.1 hypothetical protein Curi_c02240 [Gottschalkia acidurici 9a]